VELAHAGDDRLAGLLVEVDLERRVLLGELLDRRAELLLVTLGLGLDGHLDDRLGEGHRLEHDRLVDVTQGVTGGRVLQADGGVDVAGQSAESTGFSLLACIWKSLPMRSFLTLVAFSTWVPAEICPEYTRMKVSRRRTGARRP
jgi:hypothetical protein